MTERVSEPMAAIPERSVRTWPGWLGLLTSLALMAVSVWLFVLGLPMDVWEDPSPLLLVVSGLLFAASIVLLNGLFVVQPNQAEVVVLFGRYLGSVKTDGWYFVNPLTTKRKISLRVHNFTSPQLKVNDANGNPIEIAAVVVWRVVDTARAVFSVEDYNAFVGVQSETAIRHLASQYPYDDGLNEGEPSLRGSAEEVARALQRELQERLEMAGIEVIEARISHLAYSPEIAGAMLQRQQAAAIIAARQKIVEGAVSMVEMALDMLDQQQKVELSPERKADLVSNLLVVLTSDRAAQPTLPMGR
ncbi:regulator of protease activity HflC (stomatin/prohibitin superfamily) [Symbiobacterium terraclitae]|uniref:Regulator of protease activity HflC (Stomatin/prohibitin superfamily) n=1 Tax=Symbiobacterium terraclitae TaxID=557451 RepID=A0ABS4JUJ9_9FIRM|nr:regulator of protease activity HflC (stomatin/prohibitin superfamily) [Symbiobacterium terraclitae]